ncbi:MAG: hypothetical protein HJJLKODD_00500 [Phycisphaerae bacterium]|nr:hypothetical protein [Phycisphaerae bacterium]
MTLITCISWLVLAAVVLMGARGAGWSYGAALALFSAVIWALFTAAQGLLNVSTELIVLGMLGLVGVGCWSGSGYHHTTKQQSDTGTRLANGERERMAAREENIIRTLSSVPEQFAHWLEQYRQHVDPWPAYECHMRQVLQQVCRARSVRAFRVLDEDGTMIPLAEMKPYRLADTLPHGQPYDFVLHSGQHYFGTCTTVAFADQENQTTRVSEPAWVFPIQRGTLCVGLVAVDFFEAGYDPDIALLKLTAGLMAEQWGCVMELCRARVATTTDPLSGLLSRTQFLRQAPVLLERWQRDQKPATALVVEVEGLPRLDRDGWWGLRDQAVESIGQVIRRRLQGVELASRLNDEHFVMLWSPRQPQQAQEEIEQLTGELAELFRDQAKWRQEIRLHCGWTTSSGSSSTTLQQMMNSARRGATQVNTAWPATLSA